MYEYRVLTMTVNEAAEKMNLMAKQGWRVVAVSPNHAVGFGLVVTLERKTDG